MKKTNSKLLLPGIIILVILIVAIVFFQDRNSQTVNTTSITENVMNKTTSAPTQESSYTNDPLVRFTVLAELNNARIARDLPSLMTEDTLCTHAKKVANEKARSYPNDANVANDSAYSNIVSNTVTVNDNLVEVYKSQGVIIELSDDILVQQFQNETISPSVFNTSITACCVAVSDPNIGSKPFGVFVGGM